MSMSLWKKEFPDFALFKKDSFIPKIEVQETDHSYAVSAELPGMNEKDLHVTLKDNTLVIEGEKKEEKIRNEKDFYSSEFSYGTFYRSIPFASRVNAEMVKAVYKDGILHVDVEKMAPSSENARKITISKA